MPPNVPGAGPTVLFGAFDRHNFGDLLFPHIAAALLPGRDLVFAGLAARDLRPYGGHDVQALADVAAAWGRHPGHPVHLLHVGGEILSCTAWQAAVMLLPPEQAPATVTYLETRPEEKEAWTRARLGRPDLAPYAVPRHLFPRAARISYNAVGGVDLGGYAPAQRAEVQAKLRDADAVGVRDHHTLAHLAAAGIAARLMPDPAVLVAELFGAEIRRHAQQGEVAQLQRTFAQGYLAVQCSADFGDDATLATLAAQLDTVAATSGLGVALFRAGAAPWHDDLATLERLAARMCTPAVLVFRSLHLWDICALIASSRGFCGSSLHGRIVAMAFGLPRLNLCIGSPQATCAAVSKQTAYAATWEAAGLPGQVAVGDLTEGLQQALTADAALLRQTAAALARRYRAAFRWIAGADD
jgi:hypothetical protein